MSSYVTLMLRGIKEALIELIELNQKREGIDFDIPIVQNNPDCLKILDVEGRILFMNYNGLCQMEVEDFSKLRNKHWATLWGSENREVVNESIKKASEGETTSFTAFCPTAKGTAKKWDVVVSPLGSPVKNILSISRDVTQ